MFHVKHNASPSTLAAEAIWAGYGSALPALRNVSCQVACGTVTVLVGPNGSGKSTLLRCLAHALAPRQGRVVVDGHDLRALRPAALAALIAFVPQTVPPPFAFSVRELVGLSARVQPDALQSALRDLDLEPLAEHSLPHLSGGQLQRAFLARALAQNTPFLLLDEPLAHLDLRHQVRLLDRLRALTRSENKAVLLVLHDLNLAARCADRVVLLDNGEIAAQGGVADVFQQAILTTVYQTPIFVSFDARSGRPFVSPAAPDQDLTFS